MVEQAGGRSDSSAVPTIAELITAYRDRTGTPSYEAMARKVRNEIGANRLHQLHTTVPKSFAEARTMELLAEVLEVSVATIVLAYASSLGIPVKDDAPELARSLPPGTEKLTLEDREAIRAVTKALIDARRDEMAIIEAWQQTLRSTTVKFDQSTSPDVAPALPSGSLARSTEVQRLEDVDALGVLEDRPPINSPEPAEVHEYGLAARRGVSEGQRLRKQQDQDAES